MKNKTIIFFIIFIMIVSSATFAVDSVYVWSNNTVPQTIQTVSDVKENNFLNLESGAAILIEQTTGKILYAHNIHEKLRPASVTKVMTILLIMEALDGGKITLDTQIPCSENAHAMGGSQIWLDTTETLTVKDMLKSICVVSANDCTVAMAEYLAGSEEAFVQMMNTKAKQLGMKDTTFKNCHGIDEDGHVTSAYDIALMSRELLNNHPSITEYTTIWMDSIRDGKSELVNTNKLIRNYKGATGLKTGSTSLALYNLSASATRDGLSLIGVIMKAPTTKVRFAEATKLLDYGFTNYTSKSFGNKGDVICTADVNKGIEPQVNVVLEKDASVLAKKGDMGSITQNIVMKENIIAPITAGDILGTIQYKSGNDIVLERNLVAETDVAKSDLLNITKKLYLKWFNMCR